MSHPGPVYLYQVRVSTIFCVEIGGKRWFFNRIYLKKHFFPGWRIQPTCNCNKLKEEEKKRVRWRQDFPSSFSLSNSETHFQIIEIGFLTSFGDLSLLGKTPVFNAKTIFGEFSSSEIGNDGHVRKFKKNTSLRKIHYCRTVPKRIPRQKKCPTFLSPHASRIFRKCFSHFRGSA